MIIPELSLYHPQTGLNRSTLALFDLLTGIIHPQVIKIHPARRVSLSRLYHFPAAARQVRPGAPSLEHIVRKTLSNAKQLCNKAFNVWLNAIKQFNLYVYFLIII